MCRKKVAGFTFVELMASMAIVGVLSAIGYSAYMDSVRQTNRAEAKAALMEAAQRLQRCYTTIGKFNDTTNCAVYAQVDTGYQTKNGYYKIYFDATTPTATAYKLHALAIKTPQTKDTKNGCNDLTLDQNGITLPASCW